MTTINLNCDLGEGGGYDDRLMLHISACNIACGGHFGDAETMLKTVNLALNNGVKIGAHPSYPDKANFGRRPMKLSDGALKMALKSQIEGLKQIVEAAGEQLHHVKPHGYLYNEIARDSSKARLVIDTVLEIDEDLILFVPPESVVEKMAAGKIKTWKEGFADRNYTADFKLVSRQKNEAVLTEKEQVLKRVLTVAKKGEINAVDGTILTADFDTICLHGDTQNSVEILRYLATELTRRKIEIL